MARVDELKPQTRSDGKYIIFKTVAETESLLFIDIILFIYLYLLQYYKRAVVNRCDKIFVWFRTAGSLYGRKKLFFPVFSCLARTLKSVGRVELWRGGVGVSRTATIKNKWHRWDVSR